ncbi:MAG TPA: peptidylprolyl isomerase [Acidimicrobiales bacterium]|nr:peptidylprolyl isomerase [Acidimicrobiales bacterium]
MPTDKRERQRAGREARRAEAAAAQRRAARRRQILSVVGLLAVVVGIGVFINLSGKDDSTDSVDTGSDATTSTTAAAPKPAAGTSACPPADGAKEPKKAFDGVPKDCLAKGATYAADVETDAGSFTITLDAAKAPTTVNSFVFLSRYRAYEGVPFHRVIPGFVVQGGDVEKGSGSGGPGYEFADELPKAGEYEIGSVAMANSGPNTNGSQFFVITGDQGVQLPPSYSLFGKVTSGMDIVKKIEADGDASGTPKVTHKIVKVTITEKKD